MPGFSACLARVLLATLLIPIQSARPAKTLFFDDFSGRELDRTHWNVIVTGRTVNNEQQAYVDSPEVLSLENGALVIRPRFRQGFKTPEGPAFDFISGRLDTRGKVAFTYGTATARMKLAEGAGPDRVVNGRRLALHVGPDAGRHPLLRRGHQALQQVLHANFLPAR